MNCNRDIAYEAYRQGVMDADPNISLETIQVYFEKWWERRQEKQQLGTWDHYWDVR